MLSAHNKLIRTYVLSTCLKECFSSGLKECSYNCRGGSRDFEAEKKPRPLLIGDAHFNRMCFILKFINKRRLASLLQLTPCLGAGATQLAQVLLIMLS